MLLGYYPLSAQAPPRTCGSMQYLERQNLLYPAVKLERERLETEISKATEQLSDAHRKGTAAIYTIPVVVHVIYNNETQNISDAQILSQIAALNRDYLLANTDTSLIPAAFKSLKADMQMQFCLARRDPSNNPTTGITRTATTVTSFSNDDKMKFVATGGQNAWPRNKYLNIWVCNMPTYLGYGQFPGGPANTDGVTIHFRSFGSTGTAAAPYNLGRTTTHEVGHWLGLLHPFEGGCSGSGDFVADTPPQSIENYGCPSFPKFSCSGTANGDMFMNFMDYVNDNCMQMFSAGQKTRAALFLSIYANLDSVTTKSQACTPVAPGNNEASSAVALTPGTGCTGAAYNNEGATQSANERFPSCGESSGTHTVWFKFVAPAGGAVRISTDVGSGNTLTDTHLALFSASDPANYATFQVISCDDNGGSAVGNNLSVLYATGLTSGQTYYVGVDGANGTTGTFCINIDAFGSDMLSATNCGGAFQVPSGSTAYTGWVPLMDNNSKLIAMVRNTSGGAPANYTPGQYINTGTVRSGLGGKYYLDHNYFINNPGASNVEVRLFFPTTDLTTMIANSPGTSINTLAIARQSGSTCAGDYNSGNGTTTTLSQTGNGSANGISWIDFTTPGFSNFYITGGNNTALPVTINKLSAFTNGTVNHINWNAYSETLGVSYILERSNNAKSFQAITHIPGNANAGQYAYTDTNPLTGINFYRLQVIESANNTYYSNVVSARVKSATVSLQALPNPVTDRLTLNISGEVPEDASVTLTDISGKTLIHQPAVEVMNFDMHRFASGIYILKYADQQGTQVIRINKQ
jgi:hypothetical protein